jgi:transposase InsO family protein
MSKNTAIVLSVIEAGMSTSEAAQKFNVSPRWVQVLVARYRKGGVEALDPGSRRPHSNPRATSDEMIQAILQVRQELTRSGKDDGADSIAYQLQKQQTTPPSRATIHRILQRHGLVIPEPHKRPRSSWHRFQADLPNQMWQSDFTHYDLADGTGTEILNFLDDHSRFLLAAQATSAVTGAMVTTVFLQTTQTYGVPQSTLTDNGLVYTARFSQGRRVKKSLNSFEHTLQELGVRQVNGSPNHPQTQGKTERFHRTEKRWLDAHDPPDDIAALQVLLDEFRAYYNTERPHRAIGRRTPDQAYHALPKANARNSLERDYAVRTDRVDTHGKVSLRYAGTMRHLGIGRAHAGLRVRIIREGADTMVIDLATGELLAEHTIDPDRGYQPQRRRPR